LTALLRANPAEVELPFLPDALPNTEQRERLPAVRDGGSAAIRSAAEGRVRSELAPVQQLLIIRNPS
jgi:hypothetical protein